MKALFMIDLAKILSQKIESYSPKIEAKSSGRIISVGDGVVTIAGLSEAMMAEIIELPQKTKGLVLNLGQNLVGAIVLGPSQHLKEGDEVVTTGKVLSVPAGGAVFWGGVGALGGRLERVGARAQHPP